MNIKNEKTILRSIIAIFACVILFLPINNDSIFSKYIYKTCFKSLFDFIGSAYTDNIERLYLFFLLFVISIIAYFIVVKYNKFYPKKLFISVGISLVFYLVLRLCSTSWVLFPSNYCHLIAYFDIIAFAVFDLLIVLILISADRVKTINQSNVKGFLYDTPQKDGEKDDLKRKEAAQIIADRIKNTYSYTQKQKNDEQNMGDAFTVGICGEWGSGKTSFLKMVEDHLEKGVKENKDRRIIIRFNPWENHQDTAIISSFFDTLGSSLSEYVYDSKDLFGKYSQLLLDADVDSKITKAVKIFKSFAPATPTIHELYEKINANIRTIGFQIVIVIDDLDRLYPKEILEVLKLIRNSANFDNTAFIVTYDKKYILENIGKEIKNHENYLNKIVQMEYLLPIQPSFMLTRQLKNNICDLFDNQKAIIFKSNVDELNTAKTTIKKVINSLAFETEYLKHVKTLRDVVRLTNQYSIAVGLLYEKCDVGDLLKVELIKYADSSAYDWIYNNIDNCDCLEKDESGKLRENQYIFKEINGRYRGNLYESYLKLLLSKEGDSINSKSIRHRSNFKIYFLQNSFFGEIDQTEFEATIRNLDISKINEWLKSKMQIEECINHMDNVESELIFNRMVSVLVCKKRELADYNEFSKIDKGFINEIKSYFDEIAKLENGLMVFHPDCYYEIYPQKLNVVALDLKCEDANGFTEANKYLEEQFAKRRETEDLTSYYQNVKVHLMRKFNDDVSMFTALYDKEICRRANLRYVKTLAYINLITQYRQDNSIDSIVEFVVEEINARSGMDKEDYRRRVVDQLSDDLGDSYSPVMTKIKEKLKQG